MKVFRCSDLSVQGFGLGVFTVHAHGSTLQGAVFRVRGAEFIHTAGFWVKVSGLCTLYSEVLGVHIWPRGSCSGLCSVGKGHAS